MEQDYFYRAAGSADEVGPITRAGIERLIARGQLAPDDDIRRGETGPWRTVRSCLRQPQGLSRAAKAETVAEPAGSRRRLPGVGIALAVVGIVAAAIVVKVILLGGDSERSTPTSKAERTAGDLTTEPEARSTPSAAERSLETDREPDVESSKALVDDDLEASSSGVPPESESAGASASQPGSETELATKVERAASDEVVSRPPAGGDDIDGTHGPSGQDHASPRKTTSSVAAELARHLDTWQGQTRAPVWRYATIDFELLESKGSPDLWERARMPFSSTAPDDAIARTWRAFLGGDESAVAAITGKRERGSALTPEERLLEALAAKDRERTISMLESLARDAGAPPRTYVYLAMFRRAEGGDSSEALARALRSCIADPNDPAVFALLAMIALDARDRDIAELCMRRLAELDFWTKEAEGLARHWFAAEPDPVFFSPDGKCFRGWRSSVQQRGSLKSEPRVGALSGDGSVIGGRVELRAPLGVVARADAATWGTSGGTLGLGEGKLVKNGNHVVGLSGDGSRALIDVEIGAAVNTVLWDARGKTEHFPLSASELELPAPNGTTQPVTAEWFTGKGISDDGRSVAGNLGLKMASGQELERAICWTPGGSFIFLPLPAGARSSTAFGISSNGAWIVGHMDGRPCRWAASGESAPLELGRAGDEVAGSGRAVSDDGEVIVGSHRFAMGRSYRDAAFVWTQDDGYVLTANDDEALSVSELVDVSADGRIAVGTGSLRSGDGQRGVVWTPAGGLQRLKTWALATGLDIAERRLRWILTEAVAVSSDGKVLAGTAVTPDKTTAPWSIDLRPSGYPSLTFDASAAAVLAAERAAAREMAETKKPEGPKPVPSPWTPEAARTAVAARLAWRTRPTLAEAASEPIDLRTVASWVVPACEWMKDAADTGPLAAVLAGEDFAGEIRTTLAQVGEDYAALAVRAKMSAKEIGLHGDWSSAVSKSAEDLRLSRPFAVAGANEDVSRSKLGHLQKLNVEKLFPWEAWKQRAVFEGPDRDGSIEVRVVSDLKTGFSDRRVHAEREIFTLVELTNTSQKTLTDCFVVVELLTSAGYRARVFHYIDSWRPEEHRFARYPKIAQQYLPQMGHSHASTRIEASYLTREVAGHYSASLPAKVETVPLSTLLGGDAEKTTGRSGGASGKTPKPSAALQRLAKAHEKLERAKDQQALDRAYREMMQLQSSFGGDPLASKVLALRIVDHAYLAARLREDPGSRDAWLAKSGYEYRRFSHEPVAEVDGHGIPLAAWALYRLASIHAESARYWRSQNNSEREREELGQTEQMLSRLKEQFKDVKDWHGDSLVETVKSLMSDR
jgi:hypothetical protein